MWYTCTQCDYKAAWKGILKRHLDSIHRGVWYTCNLCEYKTKWKRAFKTHIESVHGNVQYSCDQCDYKAKFKVNLKIHVQTLLMEMCSTVVIIVITRQQGKEFLKRI